MEDQNIAYKFVESLRPSFQLFWDLILTYGKSDLTMDTYGFKNDKWGKEDESLLLFE